MWSENVYWQFFNGREYYEPKAPCDFTLISKFRKLIGEAGVEELLAKTISVAVGLGLLRITLKDGIKPFFRLFFALRNLRLFVQRREILVQKLSMTINSQLKPA